MADAKYNLDIFNDIYKQCCKKPLPPSFQEKSNYYIKTFSCFNSFYDPKMIWEKKKYNKKDKQQKNRFHIILHDFTKESQTKRQLTGLLNKLSSKNQASIYEKLKEIIDDNNEDEYFNLVWSYVKSSDNDLYLKVLYFFDKTLMQKNIDSYWKEYIENKGWSPPEYILQNDILRLNDEYDMYCNYAKWKKETMNMNHAWHCLKKDVSLLLRHIYDELMLYLKLEKPYKHVIDIYLEQIDRLLNVCKSPFIINNIKGLHIADFESSSKFIIYNILEKNK